MNLVLAKQRLPHPFRVPPHPEASERREAEAAELLADHHAREERERREREQALVDKVLRVREELRSALGGEGVAALRRLKAEFRDELRRKRRLPFGQTMNYEDIKDAWKSRYRGFIEQFGFRPEMVHDPIAELFKDIARLSPRADSFADYVYDYGSAVPPAAPSNPWVTYKPDYGGWQSGWDHGAVVDFSIGRTELLNSVTGHVGNVLAMDCWDASDISVASIWADTQVAFWYKAPISGLVEVNIVAHCGEARHFLHIRDEWGVSDYGVSQKSYLMMHAIHGAVRGPTYAEVSALRVEGDTSTYRDEQHILPGEVVSVTLASDSPVGAGDEFVIRAGSRSDDGVIVNDMEVNSKTTFSWFLSSVNVRIKP